MEYILLLLLFIAGTHSDFVAEDKLLKLLRRKQLERKLSLLSQFVALDWGYNGTQTPTDNQTENTPVKYLEVVADFSFNNFNLTLQQKVNSLKIKHIIETVARAIINEEHLERVIALDELAVSKKDKLTDIEKERYKYEEKLAGVLMLHEGQVATDLLIQSFAPPNLEEEVSKDSNSSIVANIYSVKLRRNVGAVNLVNELLDPSYRINVSELLIAKTHPRYVLVELNKHAAANFNIEPLISNPKNYTYHVPDKSTWTEIWKSTTESSKAQSNADSEKKPESQGKSTWSEITIPTTQLSKATK